MRELEREARHKKIDTTELLEETFEVDSTFNLEVLKAPIVEGEEEEFKKLWCQSFNLRRSLITKQDQPKDIFNFYPVFQSNLGVELVSLSITFCFFF